LNRGRAPRLPATLAPVRVLQGVPHGPPRIVEPLRLAGQPSAVLLVVGEDVKHGLPLPREAPVGLVQVAHDVKHRAALLVAFAQAALQHRYLRAQSTLGAPVRPGPRDCRLTILYRGLWR